MPLPELLLKKFEKWKKLYFFDNQSLYQKASIETQKPFAMIISCCDSRVQPTSFFEIEIGEIFLHKNVANLIPNHVLNSDENSTLAAIEYAISELKIPNIIIIGHSNCGGIKYAFEKFSGENDGSQFKYLNNWIEIIKPAYKRLNKNESKEKNIKVLEKLSIQNSISNLSNLPIVKEALDNESLKLHGVWFDISTADLHYYNLENKKFNKISYL